MHRRYWVMLWHCTGKKLTRYLNMPIKSEEESEIRGVFAVIVRQIAASGIGTLIEPGRTYVEIG
jgi:hypothetical protein